MLTLIARNHTASAYRTLIFLDNWGCEPRVCRLVGAAMCSAPVWAVHMTAGIMPSAEQCSNLTARRSGSVAAEWRFGTDPADQVRRDLGNAAHAEQCHVAIHLILQQGKGALHARLASSHR